MEFGRLIWTEARGVVDHDGNAVQDYLPRWTRYFKRTKVDGIPESSFKFYRPLDDKSFVR